MSITAATRPYVAHLNCRDRDRPADGPHKMIRAATTGVHEACPRLRVRVGLPRVKRLVSQTRHAPSLGAGSRMSPHE
jgi:hypothetical protein